MIRYVVAVLLAVAVLSVAGVALEDGADDNTDRQLQTGISDIEGAAVDLTENEELSPAGHPDPRRVVEVTVPAGSLTATGVTHFEIEPVRKADMSIARYVLDDGTRKQEFIDEPIVYHDPTDNRTTAIGGSGKRTLRLALLPDENGDPVVVAAPPDWEK
ncbi:DUF7311 family protein [Natrinema longum]|uniref:DUF7311 domain-containing protein n=1 Tax=Natrinema longum TaxID=370324 RepID=A0A8A2U8L8_9EURY|nr:hypothetical protein [Natrinema longum]MBZ6493606.1 hypothetical protein [Natrinema longum]QSW85051.1 hypothetical protein J0X27_16635 [Natrinema longum]